MSGNTLGGVVLVFVVILIGVLIIAGIFAWSEGSKAAAQIQTQKTEQIRLEVEKVRAKEEAKLQMEELKQEAELADQEADYQHELEVMRVQLDELWERQTLFEHNLILLAQVEHLDDPELTEIMLRQFEDNDDYKLQDTILGILLALLAFGVLGYFYYRTALKDFLRGLK